MVLQRISENSEQKQEAKNSEQKQEALSESMRPGVYETMESRERMEAVMAATAYCQGGIFSLPVLEWHNSLFTSRRCHRRVSKRCQLFRGVVRASSTTETPKITSKPADPASGAKYHCMELDRFSLACPICHTPLGSNDARSQNTQNSVHKKLSYTSSLNCDTCKKVYNNNGTYLDLTIDEFIDSMPRGTELFRSSMVSFLYERGWRQFFTVAGFPGPEKEFEMANEYLKTSFGGTVIDASCGSGLFSRLFSKSRFYKHVVALDFSENMLKQCSDFINQEGLSRDNIVLVRADISRLPFDSGSVDAVHAGAALHCWPSPSAAMDEISRILRPGGVFVGTTFISDKSYGTSVTSLLTNLAVNFVSGEKRFTSEGDLETLCSSTGLVGFTCVRNKSFIMISATKPS